MDFLDPAKKRKNGIKLIIGYLLVGIAIGLAALILIFLSYGYSLDRKTGAVIQNGIIFVASKPSDAEVYLNGEKYDTNTDARIVVPSAQYKLELKKNGYRIWQRDFFLSGGQIERLVYPLLFPTELPTSDVETYRTIPVLSTQSPDRRWLLVQQTATKPTFVVYDLNQDTPVGDTITIPADVLSDGTKSFSVVEWSTDNRHVLLKHAYKNKSEFIVVDREKPAESINVTTLTKGAFNTMSLRDKKYDQWYLHNTGEQQLFTASQKQPVPDLLIDDVIAYKPHGNDVILYATEQKATKNKARIVIWDDGRSDTLREVAKSKKYLLDVARFEDKWYFVASGASDGKVYVYKEPFDAIRATTKQTLNPTTIMRVENPTYVSFSQTTRFVSVQSGAEFAVYDAETKRSYRYNTDLAFGDQQAVWMDGHRMTGIIDEQVVVFDYDGTNVQRLTRAIPASLPYFSANYENLYTIAQKSKAKEANLAKASLLVP